MNSHSPNPQSPSPLASKIPKSLFTAAFLLSVIPAAGQALDPALLTKPLAESWPTYSGDYSGKRYSKLTQINQSTVKNLTLAWTARVNAGAGNAGGGGGGRGGRGFGGGEQTIIGG